jgi:hypothetical protein
MARRHRRPAVAEAPELLVDTLVNASHLARIRTLLEHVREKDGALFLSRSHELAFLANTLVAGCSVLSRAFTPQEASDAAIGICNLGLEHWPATLPDTFLIDHNLVSLFEIGWSVLHEDVSLFVAKELLGALPALRCSDRTITEGLKTLRRELGKQRKAGTPWKARQALDVIAMLDVPLWISLVGLLDECPVIPAALTATLEGRAGKVSATEFEFIATRRQLATIREFMTRIPDIVTN